MYSKKFHRGGGDPDYIAREEEFSKRYVHKARHLANHFAMGQPNLKLKALVKRMINKVAEHASFESVDAILAKLGAPGQKLFDLSTY